MRRIGIWFGVAIFLVAPVLNAAEPSSGAAERPAGTGVIVHPDGYILTAHHVVSNARRIVVVTPGEFGPPAIIVITVPEHDFTLLKIETAGLSNLPIAYAAPAGLDEEAMESGFRLAFREVSSS